MADRTDPADRAEASRPTLLKELLHQRHWLPYRRFRREYDRVAAELDRALVGTYPSEATYRRWLSGRIVGVPRSEPCAVLGAMFPGYAVEQLFEPPPIDGPVANSDVWEPRPLPNGNVPQTEGVDTSKRRDLLAAAAAVAFGAALDEPAARIITQADEPKIPATVRVGDVRDLQVATEMLEAWDHQAGGGTVVRHHILGALRWGMGLLDGSCTPQVRRRLAATVAQLADLAAWATFDAGLDTQARELFLLGLHAAHESEDLGIRAHVATGLARQEIHTGYPDAALGLVQLAHSAADALTPNAVSMLHTVKALAYAKKPDSDQCRRFVHLALDGYRPESIDNDPPWIRYFTAPKLNGDTANAMFDLMVTGSPMLGKAVATKYNGGREELVTHLTNTVARYPDSRARSKAIAGARLATLLYLEGAPTEANEAADTALRLAENIRSARLGDDLRVLVRATGAAGRDSAAEEIRTRARVFASAMT